MSEVMLKKKTPDSVIFGKHDGNFGQPAYVEFHASDSWDGQSWNSRYIVGYAQV